MKKILLLLVSFLTLVSASACTGEEMETNDNGENSAGNYFSGKKVLVAYFSWGGTTQRMAQQIIDLTGPTRSALSLQPPTLLNTHLVPK